MALMLKTEEKQLVLKAIDDLGRRVTVADVAAKTGLPVLVANAELNKVAAETQGHLQVSTKGDIAYEFTPGFQNVYLATGIKKTLQDIGKKIFDIGFAILRASFGIMLVLSFIAVILLVIAAILAMNSSKDGDRDGGGLDFDFFDFMIFRDLMFWGSTSYYPPYVDYNSPSSARPAAAKSNFLHNCFSFLFGDGDPNAHLDERQWQLVAQVIRKFHGVVTAEQIAPYTGADPKNEDGILPVLVRFNGVPEVTENGHILYTFPSLQVSASRLEIATTPAFLREFPRQFTNASADELIPVYILAGVNFLGSWWLLSQTFRPGIIQDLQALVVALVIYGTFFVGVPTVRFLCLQVINQRIEARNDKKKEAASIVNNPSKDLQLKLLEAKNHQIKHNQIAKNDVAYTSDKDLLEQEFDT